MKSIQITLSIIFLLMTYTACFVLYTGGNSWSLDKGTISTNGYTFSNVSASFNTYFYTSSVTNFTLEIVLNNSVNVNITATVGQITNTISINSSALLKNISLGNFISQSGYNKIQVKIVSNISGSLTGKGLVSAFNVNGQLSGLTYVVDNAGSYFYWGRRGASTHLSYIASTAKNISYFYSEINVPVGYDPQGSYYMANGFSQGYFGIQVNSATERRVLFSVWSGYVTNDPSQIPTNYTVKLNRIGPQTKTGVFGGQGSGGQSYLLYNWVAGKTYGFLTKATPNINDSTTYTAWFRDTTNTTYPDWRLIAEWTRPKVTTYLKGIYSFIECFDTNFGNQTRMGTYTNQWYYDYSNTWKEALKITNTKDGTGNNNQRRDVTGGLYTDPSVFYLKTGGFFNETGIAGTTYIRQAKGVPPPVDFATLP